MKALPIFGCNTQSIWIEIIRSVWTDIVYISYTKNIIPLEIGDDKWEWVSNQYFLSYEDLEMMMEEIKKYGTKFDIVGEPNYSG